MRVTADPKAWAHDAFTRLLALAAVYADSDRARKIAAMLWHVGVSVTQPGILVAGPIEMRMHTNDRDFDYTAPQLSRT